MARGFSTGTSSESTFEATKPAAAVGPGMVEDFHSPDIWSGVKCIHFLEMYTVNLVSNSSPVLRSGQSSIETSGLVEDEEIDDNGGPYPLVPTPPPSSDDDNDDNDENHTAHSKLSIFLELLDFHQRTATLLIIVRAYGEDDSKTTNAWIGLDQRVNVWA